jgi:hypothetical protein
VPQDNLFKLSPSRAFLHSSNSSLKLQLDSVLVVDLTTQVASSPFPAEVRRPVVPLQEQVATLGKKFHSEFLP